MIKKRMDYKGVMGICVRVFGQIIKVKLGFKKLMGRGQCYKFRNVGYWLFDKCLLNFYYLV